MLRFLTLLLMAISAGATDVYFDLSATKFNANPAAARIVQLQPLTPFVGNLITYTSSAGGTFYFSNAPAGDYSGSIRPKGTAGEILFQITVTATNLGVVEAAGITSIRGQQTYPTAGKSSWTIQSSDGRYVRLPTNNATASDGQVVSKTGDATKWVTGGGAGSQTPWEQNVSGAGYSLSNVLNLRATNITSRFFTNSGDARIDGDVILAGTATIGLANIGAAATIDEDGDAYFPTVSGSGGLITNLTTIGATNVNATRITSATITNTGDAKFNSSLIVEGTATLGLANIGAAATIDEDGDAYFPTLTAGGGSLTNYQTVQSANVNATRMTTSTITNASGGAFGGDVYFSSKVTAGLADIGLATIDEDGDAYFPTIAGDGSGITNVPSKFVASINALTNLPVQSNLIVYVESYFGTNARGGGKFIWENSSATVDYGYVFYGASGRWRRIDTGYDTNVFLMENYGVVPNAAIDSYIAAQAAINATPTAEGKTILPNYNFAIGQTLWYTNRRGSYLGTLEIGKVRSSGYRVFPNPTCVIHWMGVNGGTNMVAYDSGHNTFAGFGLDTRIGLNNGDQWTNAAGLLMDVDMNPTHSTTTSANVFDGIYFRERGTNTALVGQRIASYNWQNCEFFRWYDCYWQGGGWNLPQYWVQTTNLGAFKAVQLGGNGGGQNSFQHYMFNCGWDRWMYNIHSSGGNWVLDIPKSTAAGAAAFYLNGDHPSIIRFADCEGDRQFLVSPGDTVQLVGNRIADVVQAGYTNLPPIDAVKLLAYGNYLQHEAYIAAITNSFNSTGSYDGAGNSFDTTNDALIASWRFNSAFNSRGDFGTLKDHNNIQSGPWKTPSALQGTNIVYQTLTDSATFPVMTLMSSNGGVAIGGYINNVVASLWNKDYATRVHFQIGDPYRTDRFNLTSPSSGARTMAQLKSDDASYLQLSTTNTRVDFNTGFGRNSIVFVQNYGEIVGTNNQQLVYFGTDYKIKFPYDTNFEVVGPIHGNILRATNHVTWFTNNSFTSLDPTPLRYGQVSLVNSNGVMWQVTATSSGVLAWEATNTVPTTAAQIVAKFSGTPSGKYLKDDGTLGTPAGGGSQTPWTSDIDGAGYSLTDALGVRVTSGGFGTALGGGDLFHYAQGYRVSRVSVDGSGIPSFAFGPDSNSLGSSGGGNAIVAGDHNTNSGDYQSVILGGAVNVIGVGSGQVILGGANNIAAGNYNAVLGGAGNIVSNESFALGQKALATNRAAVVIAAQDSVTPVAVNSLSNETIFLYAPNGVTINTNNGTTNALFVFGSGTVSSNWNVGGKIIGDGSGLSGLNTYGFGTNTAAASSWTNSGNHNFTGNVIVSGTLQAGALTTTLGGSATIWDHSTFAGASAGQEIWDALKVAGTAVAGPVFKPNDVQQPTNIMFRVDYPILVATNYVATDFIPVVGRIKYCYSNYVIYAVSPAKTNLISDLR